MTNPNTFNQHLRTGPSFQHFQADVRVTFLWALKKLPALAMVIAQVLTIQLSTPRKQRTHTINLNSAKIARGSFNPLKISIKTRQRTYNLFFNNGDEADVWESVLEQAASRKFDQYYSHVGPLADGRNSKLFVEQANQNPNDRFVVKINTHRNQTADTIRRSKHERDAHLRLLAPFPNTKYSALFENKKHPERRPTTDHKPSLGFDKIITLRDFFSTPTEDVLVFDYNNGMPLSEAITMYGPLSERNAKIVIWDLLKAVDYMHQQGVVHRDIRASNVLYWNRHGNARAKLFNLSDARIIDKTSSRQQPFVDSPLDSPGYSPYKAIEVLTDRNHGKPADIWSLGVVLYKMIAGVEPFLGDAEVELHHAILASMLTDSLFSPKVWKNISSEFKSLVQQMLQPDPLKRVSAFGAICSRWLDSTLYRVDTGIPALLRSPEARSEGKRLRQNTTANTTDYTTAKIVDMALPPGSAKAHELRMKWRENASPFVPLNMSIGELISMRRKHQDAEDTPGNDPFLTYEPPDAAKHGVIYEGEGTIVVKGLAKKLNIGRRVQTETTALDPQEPVQDSGQIWEEESFPPLEQVAAKTTSQEVKKRCARQQKEGVQPEESSNTRSLRNAALTVIATSNITNLASVAPAECRGTNGVLLDTEFSESADANANANEETRTRHRRRLRIQVPEKLSNLWSFLKGCFSSTPEAESNKGSTDGDDNFDLQMAMAKAISAKEYWSRQ